jgi:hypothetical protein
MPSEDEGHGERAPSRSARRDGVSTKWGVMVGGRSGVGSAGAEQGPDPSVRAAHPQLAMGHRYGNAVSDRPRFPTSCHKDGDTDHLRPEPDRVHSRGGTNGCASGCCSVL